MSFGELLKGLQKKGVQHQVDHLLGGQVRLGDGDVAGQVGDDAVLQGGRAGQLHECVRHQHGLQTAQVARVSDSYNEYKHTSGSSGSARPASGTAPPQKCTSLNINTMSRNLMEISHLSRFFFSFWNMSSSLG